MSLNNRMMIFIPIITNNPGIKRLLAELHIACTIPGMAPLGHWLANSLEQSLGLQFVFLMQSNAGKRPTSPAEQPLYPQQLHIHSLAIVH